MSSALPAATPGKTSNMTTSPSSFRPIRWARVPPILPAPISAIFLRAMSRPSSGSLEYCGALLLPVVQGDKARRGDAIGCKCPGWPCARSSPGHVAGQKPRIGPLRAPALRSACSGPRRHGRGRASPGCRPGIRSPAPGGRRQALGPAELRLRQAVPRHCRAWRCSRPAWRPSAAIRGDGMLQPRHGTRAMPAPATPMAGLHHRSLAARALLPGAGGGGRGGLAGSGAAGKQARPAASIEAEQGQGQQAHGISLLGATANP